MELSVTPAGSLCVCKARGVSINEVKNGNEPGMQADQWGKAGSAADGVRSNVTLDSASRLFDILCMLLLLGGRPAAPKKIQKMFTTNTQIEVLKALSASTLSVMRQRFYALRFLALFSCFIHSESQTFMATRARYAILFGTAKFYCQVTVDRAIRAVAVKPCPCGANAV